MAGDGDTITIAFELAALDRLADPGRVLKDTRQWTAHLGIVSDEPSHVVRKRARDHGITPDFLPGPRDRAESLVKIKNQPEHDADRFIFVSTDEELSSVAAQHGWEFQLIEAAAETAGWHLHDGESEDDEEHTGWP
jgi:3-deoxy-D-manno-octulosonate 8-phosphate phosphatase KdsC-like HAD superfamily phosphatase